MKKAIFFCLIFLEVSCSNYCRLLGEKPLGNNFTLVESDKDHINIIYCTSKPCCDVGINIVPSNIVEYNFNSKWIVAKSKDSIKENYWLIDKEFKIKFEHESNMKEKVLSHVIGPIDSVSFVLKSKEMGVNLEFKR